MDEKIDTQRLGGTPSNTRHEDPRTLAKVERTCGNEQAREQNCERYQVNRVFRGRKNLT